MPSPHVVFNLPFQTILGMARCDLRCPHDECRSRTRYLRSNITAWMGKVSLEYGRDDWRDATMLRALRVAAGYIV
jgi:hypothetical protein